MVDESPIKSDFTDRLEALIPQMRAFARGLCRDAVLADDLVQEACLRAWSAAESFDESQEMRPWIFRILRNEFYMMMRRAWRSVGVEPDFAEQALVVPDPQEVRQDFTRMERLIFALPARQRDALLLVVAAGMTYEEAGDLCGCSPGTMKSRVSRAREALLARFFSSEATHSAEAAGEEGMEALLLRIDVLTAPARLVA